MRKENIIYRLGSLNGGSAFVQDIAAAIGQAMEHQDADIEQITKDMFFTTCSESMLDYYEAEAGIVPAANQSIDARRSTLIARWRSNGKSDLELLQLTADAWQNGKVQLDFRNGVIEVSFTDKGLPEDLDALKAALEEVAPAHLPFNYTVAFTSWAELAADRWNNLSSLTWAELRVR